MGGEGDKGYLLTSISHGATDQSQRGEHVNTPGALLFHFSSEPISQGVKKGAWITDVTYESGALGQPAVATENLTIAHEGFFLF